MKKQLLLVLSLVLVLTALVAGSASGASAPAAAKPSATTAPAIAVRGQSTATSAEIGKVLTVTGNGTYASAPDSYTYEWLQDGETILDPATRRAVTGSTYAVRSGDVGHTVAVLVTASSGKRIIDKEPSNAVAAITDTLVAPVATVVGGSTVGSRLTARLSGGTADAVTTITWLRDGAVVSEDDAYVVVAGDAGHVISIRTTASESGHPTASRVARARAISAKNVARPRIRGTVRVGRTLAVRSKGTWYGAGYSYTYRWLRNGHAIRGAVKGHYRLTRADRGRRVSLRVTAQRSGFPTVVAVSTRTRAIRR